MKEKTILVTGAASGIGAATADLLKERGATVIAFDKQEPSKAYDEFIQIDLADETAILDAASTFSGKADALCNIAGVPPTVPPVPLLAVNFTGLRMFTERLIPKLNDNASIVNIASLAGIQWRESVKEAKALFALKSFEELEGFVKQHGINQENCYEFSKEALILWTMQNWNTFGRGIRMNAVSPSATQTPILKDFAGVAKRVQARNQGLTEKPDPGKPEDIAPIVAFLCSDDSRWIKGSNIVVDGGLFAAITNYQLEL